VLNMRSLPRPGHSAMPRSARVVYRIGLPSTKSSDRSRRIDRSGTSPRCRGRSPDATALASKGHGREPVREEGNQSASARSKAFRSGTSPITQVRFGLR